MRETIGRRLRTQSNVLRYFQPGENAVHTDAFMHHIVFSPVRTVQYHRGLCEGFNQIPPPARTQYLSLCLYLTQDDRRGLSTYTIIYARND